MHWVVMHRLTFIIRKNLRITAINNQRPKLPNLHNPKKPTRMHIFPITEIKINTTIKYEIKIENNTITININIK